jgi:hypothetical protein
VIRILLTLLVCPGLLACSNPVAGPLIAGSIEIAQGDGQTAAVGSVLPQPLTVLVSDPLGRPLWNATVQWSVSSGGGSVAPAQSTTGVNGLATTIWTLGSVEGTQEVSAQVGQVPALTFTATAVVP